MDKMNEPKSRTKFVELAVKRVNRTIKDIRLIGNLSNKTNYSYTDEDVKKILKALRTEVESLKSRFDASGGDSEQAFKL
jgi:hypothetical protein